MEVDDQRTTSRKLTTATLAPLAGRVTVPTYDRKRLVPAIVHDDHAQRANRGSCQVLAAARAVGRNTMLGLSG